jgi:predicted metalloendopeptidase
MSPAELQALTPGFDWSRYFVGIAAPAIQAINVTEPDFFRGFAQTIASTSLDDIKAYLRWHLVHTSAAVLPTAFVNENFRFYGTVLAGTRELRPRWKRCIQYTDSDLGEALGKAFVKEAFGERAKADTLAMVHQLESALEQDIAALTWMTDATKKQALVKLQAITNKIGYPDRWRDRQERVGDDAADRQRVLQSAAEQHQLPGRHSPAAVLQREGRRRAELRRRRCRDRPRVDPRIRRSRAAVRCAGQLEQLVDARGRESVREAGGLLRRRVRELHGGR